MASALKMWLTGIVAAAMVVLGIITLNSGDVTCGGEVMHAGDRCVGTGGSRGRDEQASENNGTSWIMIIMGGLVLAGFAGVGILELNRRRRG